jgi:hypothetical protein
MFIIVDLFEFLFCRMIFMVAGEIRIEQRIVLKLRIQETVLKLKGTILKLKRTVKTFGKFREEK